MKKFNAVETKPDSNETTHSTSHLRNQFSSKKEEITSPKKKKSESTKDGILALDVAPPSSSAQSNHSKLRFMSELQKVLSKDFCIRPKGQTYSACSSCSLVVGSNDINLDSSKQLSDPSIGSLDQERNLEGVSRIGLQQGGSCETGSSRRKRCDDTVNEIEYLRENEKLTKAEQFEFIDRTPSPANRSADT